VGTLPNLSESFGARYHVDPFTGRAEPTEPRPLTGQYDKPITNRAMFRINPLSDVAKMDSTGAPERGFKYKLPPMAITALIINALHISGPVQPRNGTPYPMRAIGPVKLSRILAGGRGFVTDDVSIIP
jgi:hypothetical protein